MCARIGAMLSPLLFELGDTIPLYLLAFLSFFTMLYSVKLPETFNQKPIERLEDLTKNCKNNEHQLEKMALLLNSLNVFSLQILSSFINTT